MSALWIDLGIIVILIAGIAQFRVLRAARTGNLTAAAALLCALVAVLHRHGVLDPALVVVVAVLGTLIGGWVAARVNMIQIPAMVAFQHGAGGVAAFLVSFVELTRDAAVPLTRVAEVAALLGLVVGAATFSGSMIASGKLANRLRQTPTILPRHNWLLWANVVVIASLGIWAGATDNAGAVLAALLALLAGAIVLGIIFAVRIGGADMPVLISFLNATAGLAAAFCGIAIGNRLLIACGATVAASGSILTHVMCRAMNRGLVNVFAGLRPASDHGATLPGASATTAEAPANQPAVQALDPFGHAVSLLRDAQRVIIIPGYGMALAEASEEVVQLGERLSEVGKEVLFAIHPVAGRMPGHMHVLLAEAEVDYANLRELKDVNGDFIDTDVALVVGACDVVNPAAIEQSDTPISGMTILRAHEARNVIVCNLDEQPGYSGVPNPLYRKAQTVLLLGDAKTTVGALRDGLEGPTDGVASDASSTPTALKSWLGSSSHNSSAARQEVQPRHVISRRLRRLLRDVDRLNDDEMRYLPMVLGDVLMTLDRIRAAELENHLGARCDVIWPDERDLFDVTLTGVDLKAGLVHVSMSRDGPIRSVPPYMVRLS